MVATKNKHGKRTQRKDLPFVMPRRVKAGTDEAKEQDAEALKRAAANPERHFPTHQTVHQYKPQEFYLAAGGKRVYVSGGVSKEFTNFTSYVKHVMNNTPDLLYDGSYTCRQDPVGMARMANKLLHILHLEYPVLFCSDQSWLLMGKGNPMEFIRTKFQGVRDRYNRANPDQVNQRLSSIHRVPRDNGRDDDGSSNGDEAQNVEVSFYISYHCD